VGSVTSGVHTGTEPPVGSGAHEKYAEKMTVTNSILTVQTKKILSVAISDGDVSPCPSLLYDPASRIAVVMLCGKNLSSI